MTGYRLAAALGVSAVAALTLRMPRPPARRLAASECVASTRDLRPVDFRGRWIVDVTPDSAVAVAGIRLGRMLTGSIQFVQRDSSARGIVYTGSYAADLRTVGLAKPSGQILASVPPGDTVRIILDPTVLHGNLELVGRCRSGQLVGNWVLVGDPARAWGRFTLRRQEKSK